MPRTFAKLRQIEEYAWRRWQESEYACDLWWNAAHLCDRILRTPSMWRDARYVCQVEHDGQ